MCAKLLLLLPFVLSVQANLEGPFLFFGPEYLSDFQLPALKYLDQDDLTRIYSQQEAIVVFNNQDSVPLASASFPRLRKMLERLGTLVLTQDFLDVHPDYISNNTQVLLLQGPWSERDAKMTETFERLQDVYGHGNVLGILGNSVSQVRVEEVNEDQEWGRVRRQAGELTTATSVSAEDERPPRQGNMYTIYNATGPPGQSILMCTTGYPVLEFANGTVIELDTPVGQPTVKPTRLYTSLVVRFLDKNTRDKITVEFSFKQSMGWWQAVGVEVKFGLETAGMNLQAPAPPDAPAAVLDHSYECPLPLVYASEEAKLRLPNIKLQAYMDNTEKFSDSFSCISFFTVPIWSGLLVTTVLASILTVSVVAIMDIKTNDRFESHRNKQLTITVYESRLLEASFLASILITIITIAADIQASCYFRREFKRWQDSVRFPRRVYV